MDTTFLPDWSSSSSSSQPNSDLSTLSITSSTTTSEGLETSYSDQTIINQSTIGYFVEEDGDHQSQSSTPTNWLTPPHHHRSTIINDAGETQPTNQYSHQQLTETLQSVSLTTNPSNLQLSQSSQTIINTQQNKQQLPLSHSHSTTPTPLNHPSHTSSSISSSSSSLPKSPSQSPSSSSLSSSSSPPDPKTPADNSSNHQTSTNDLTIPSSQMAPPPRPAEKSRAGKRALAAIQGGGGLGVRGPKASILQRVISRTRPKDLPPKAPEEDQKHLKEFSEMMAASLETRKREASLEIQRKLAREQMIASYQPTWEKEVLPNWKTVLRDDQSGKELRKMWWLGTMPPRHRGRLWHQCIGNAGAVGRSAYMKSVSLAKSLMSSTPSRFPDDVLRSIDEDISRTLPRLKLFQEDRPMHSDFRQVLLAWSVFWRERPYYPTGSSHVAALLLINMPPADAFLSLVNLTRKSCLSYFYNQKVSEIEGFYRIFENLFSESMPKLYKNFRERRLLPSFYLEPWIRSVYISHLPLELSTRIMDVFVLEGDSFLFRVALTILETLEARLYNPDRLELEAVLTGTDRGSRLLVVRNQMLKQGSNVERSIDDVGVDESYEEMGCDEERIFKSLNERSWNENLWDRLVARELPD